MTATTTYRGRKIAAKAKTDRRTGRRFVDVSVNGQYAWSDSAHDATPARSVELAKRYIDDAIARPGAYPVLDMA